MVILPIEKSDAAGISWSMARIGGLSMEVPSAASGWRVTIGPDQTLGTPSAVFIVNADASATVVVDIRSGDAYWKQLFADGAFHEFKVRTSSPVAWQASDSELNAFYSANGAIVSHIVNSIKAEATATPTASPTATGTPPAVPSKTATPVGELVP
jgi:hypothetical protein